MSEGKFDPHRRLCPDGACIGVIGSDGRCHVCGRAVSGGNPTASPAPSADAVDDEDDVDNKDGVDDDDEDGVEDESPLAATGAGFDPNRRLCPDGDCLGVLGADGVCNVCGKKAD